MPHSQNSIEYNAYICDLLTKWLFSKVNQPLVIMDFGCGDGMLTYFMSRSFPHAHCIGIDTDEEKIYQNQKSYPSCTFMTIKDNLFPFETNSFDVLYAINVMHHIPEGQRKNIINQFVRLLKPHGVVFILELNPYHWKTRTSFKEEHDAALSMIYPYDLKKLIQTTSLNTKIIYLYPRLSGGKFHYLEPYFSNIPFGSLYACVATKK